MANSISYSYLCDDDKQKKEKEEEKEGARYFAVRIEMPGGDFLFSTASRRVSLAQAEPYFTPSNVFNGLPNWRTVRLN